MNQSARICVVEDDQKIADVLCDYLQAEAYQSIHFSDGLQALQNLKVQACDLILLDRLLPGIDGIALCHAIRAFSNAPIIMLTALIDESDKLDGLEAGADDYICKPFSPREVMARVKAQLRRSQLSTQSLSPVLVPVQTHFEIMQQTLPPLHIEQTNPQLRPASKAVFSIQEENLSILVASQNLNLTVVEFRILAELLKHPQRVYNRQQLLSVANEDYRDSGDRTIDVHIKNIRKKISAISNLADCLQSVYGVGYRYQPLAD